MGRKEKLMPIGEMHTPILGRLLRHFRNERGFSLTKMAILTDFSVSHLSNVERGQAQTSQELLRQYEKHLSLQPNEVGAFFLLLYIGTISIGSSLTDASSVDRNNALEIAEVLDSSPPHLELVVAFIQKIGCGLSKYLELYQPLVADLLRRHACKSSHITVRLHILLEELYQRV